MLVVAMLDRLARNVRETLNLVHELTEIGIHLRSLRNLIPINTSSNGMMAQMSVVMLALFAEMERV